MKPTDKELVTALHAHAGLGNLSASEVVREAEIRHLIGRFPQDRFLVRESDGSTSGPHPADVLKTRYLAGEISGQTLLHVKSKMGWLPLEQVFECKAWRPADRVPPKQRDIPVIEEPAPEIRPTAPTPTGPEKPGGLSRAAFASALSALAVLLAIAFELVPANPAAHLAIGTGGGLAFMTITYRRLLNMGSPVSMVLVTLVPIANLWLLGRCLSCPTGFETEKKLDERGTTIFYAYLACLIAFGLTLATLFFFF